MYIVESLLPERLTKFIFSVGTPHLPRHHLQKFVKLDGTVSILIHFIHHITQFRLCKKCIATCLLIHRCSEDILETSSKIREE